MNKNHVRPRKNVRQEGPEVAAPKTEKPQRGGKGDENWERDMISRLAFASLTEQRRARRWNIFFKLLIFTYLFMVFWLYQGSKLGETSLVDGDHTALVEIKASSPMRPMPTPTMW